MGIHQHDTAILRLNSKGASDTGGGQGDHVQEVLKQPHTKQLASVENVFELIKSLGKHGNYGSPGNSLPYVFINFTCLCLWGGGVIAYPRLLQTSFKCLSKETSVQFLGWEDLLEKEMATHSSILAWKSPWTEGSGRL